MDNKSEAEEIRLRARLLNGGSMVWNGMGTLHRAIHYTNGNTGLGFKDLFWVMLSV